MSDVFILGSMQQEYEPGRAGSPAETLQALLGRSGLQARRVQEVHWLGQHGALGGAGLTGNTAVFEWPPAALLDHFLLHAAARAIQLGERDVVLLGQDWQAEEQTSSPAACTALILASPAAVGRYNLLARARLALRLSLAASPQDALGSTAERLGARARSAQEAEKRRVESLAKALASGSLDPSHLDEGKQEDPLPPPGEVQWLASGYAFEPGEVEQAFPQSRRLVALPPAPPGDLFLLHSLLKALADSRTRWGLLLSPGPQTACLSTLVEKI